MWLLTFLIPGNKTMGSCVPRSSWVRGSITRSPSINCPLGSFTDIAIIYLLETLANNLNEVGVDLKVTATALTKIPLICAIGN